MGAVIVIAGVMRMVVIHEAAHFVAAKSFGMKATEAFFGFGPRLWSVKRGETEYGIKAFPLGGYVRIIGMNPFEDVDPADEGRTYRENPFWKKSVVVLAGIASHFVVAAILMYSLTIAYGTAATTTEIGALNTVLGERELELRSDDTIVAIDGIPIDRWTGSDGDGDRSRITIVRDGETLEIVTDMELVPTPAFLSGIREGDRLIEMDGTRIETWDDFVDIAQSSPGETVDIVYERNGLVDTVTATLAVIESADGTQTGFCGVAPNVVTEGVGPIAAVGETARDMWAASRASVQGLVGVVTNFGDLLGAAVGDGEVPADRPISPIGLVRIAGEVERAIVLLAFVNVFVGVLNFVPLYPLDGGHFAVALYEKVRGRDADVRKLMPIAVAVFVFVVLLGLLGIYFDLVDPISLPE